MQGAAYDLHALQYHLYHMLITVILGTSFEIQIQDKDVHIHLPTWKMSHLYWHRGLFDREIRL